MQTNARATIYFFSREPV